MACGCSQHDDVCLAGSAEACHARQMAIAANKRLREAVLYDHSELATARTSVVHAEADNRAHVDAWVADEALRVKPLGWRPGIRAAAKAWADEIDRRAFNYAWAAMLEDERLSNSHRVRSGRERLGE